jgi:hypothetical protein
MHCPSEVEQRWFSHLLESGLSTHSRPSTLSLEWKRRIHKLLAQSEVFDNFLQLKFPNLKRVSRRTCRDLLLMSSLRSRQYGLEGGESMLPALDSLFSAAAKGVRFMTDNSCPRLTYFDEDSISHIIVAMPHRGRLNFLTDLLEFSPIALFHKIKGGYELPAELGVEGDVLSHLSLHDHLRYSSTLLTVLKHPPPISNTKGPQIPSKYLFYPTHPTLVLPWLFSSSQVTDTDGNGRGRKRGCFGENASKAIFSLENIPTRLYFGRQSDVCSASWRC